MIGYLIEYAILPVTIGGITGGEKRKNDYQDLQRKQQRRNGISTSEGDIKVLCHLYVNSVSNVDIHIALYMVR